MTRRESPQRLPLSDPWGLFVRKAAAPGHGLFSSSVLVLQMHMQAAGHLVQRIPGTGQGRCRSGRRIRPPSWVAPAKRKTAPPNRRERVRNAWVDHATFRPCYSRVQALGESIVVPSMSKLMNCLARWAAQTRFGSGTRPFPVRSPVAVGWGEPSCRAFGGPFRHACSTLRSLARHGRPKRPRPFG